MATKQQSIRSNLSLWSIFFACTAMCLAMPFETLRANTVYIGGSPTEDGDGEIGEPVGGPSGGAVVQWLLLGSETTALGNDLITGMAFRLDQDYAPDLPAFGYEHLKITLGYTTATDLLDSDIDANNGAASGLTTVYDGSFYYGAGAFPTGDAPNDFGSFIKFTTAFQNDTNQNLIFTIWHTAPILPDGSPLYADSYFSADAGFAGRNSVVGDYNQFNTFTYFYTPVSAFTTDSLPANYTPDVAPEPSSVLLVIMGAAFGLYHFRSRWWRRA